MPKILRGKFNIIPAVLMSCRYCTHWINADRNGYLDQENEDGTKKQRIAEGVRKCLISQSDVDRKTIACDDFVLHKSFWCNKGEHFLDIIVCISRQNKRQEGCCFCRQGTLISNFTNQERRLS